MDDHRSTDQGATMHRHPFDPVAFIFGAMFVLVAMLGLLDPDVVRSLDLRVLLPGALIAIGGTLLLGSLGRDGRRADVAGDADHG
jgi:hypothetical protein